MHGCADLEKGVRRAPDDRRLLERRETCLKAGEATPDIFVVFDLKIR